MTDLHVGSGAACMARVVSASADQTVRLWDLGTGHCLFTFLFDHVVSSVIMDPCEYHLYAGLFNGEIVQVSLFNIAEANAPGVGATIEAKTTSTDTSANPRVKALTRHKARVTCLSTSFDASALASSSEDGDACIWDLRSRQVIRTLPHKGAVTNLAFVFAPYLMTEETSSSNSGKNLIHAKDPIWPQLQKRLKEQEDAYSVNKEILHDVVVK